MYAETLNALLEKDGQEAVHLAALLDEVDAFSGVEIAIREAGFCVGFNTARELLLGELDLEALKAGEE